MTSFYICICTYFKKKFIHIHIKSFTVQYPLYVDQIIARNILKWEVSRTTLVLSHCYNSPWLFWTIPWEVRAGCGGESWGSYTQPSGRSSVGGTWGPLSGSPYTDCWSSPGALPPPSVPGIPGRSEASEHVPAAGQFLVADWSNHAVPMTTPLHKPTNAITEILKKKLFHKKN